MMGLLGIFFNRWFLKIILIIAAIFILLQALQGFFSFTTRLETIQLAALAVIVLAAFAALSARSERFKSLSGLTKFLGFAVVPSVPLFEATTVILPPSSLASITAFTIAALPYIAYFAYREGISNWSNPASPRSIRRRCRKLTMSSLSPKGIETGHVAFGAGRRGLRTLRFIEIKNQELQTTGPHTAFEVTHCKTLKALSAIVTVAKKLRVEFSYELHWENGTPHILVAAISEGRDYGGCRSLVDEFTRILTQHLRLNHAKTPSVTQVADSTKAEKILMIPLFLDPANSPGIESDDRNIMLTSNTDQDRRTRLRIMRVSDLPRIWESTGVSLLNELLRIVAANSQARNLFSALHVKPFPDSYLKRDTRKLEEAYHSAMARIIEVNTKVHIEKSLAMSLLIEHDKDAANAISSANEAKNRLQLLRDAESSGYFGVSMILIGEPAIVESIKRQLKTKLSSLSPDLQARIERLPPTAFQAAIRRDPLILSDRLGGHELTMLLTAPEFTPEKKTDRSAPAPGNTFDSSAIEESVSQ
jgi:hypothetical protein